MKRIAWPLRRLLCCTGPSSWSTTGPPTSLPGTPGGQDIARYAAMGRAGLKCTRAALNAAREGGLHPASRWERAAARLLCRLESVARGDVFLDRLHWALVAL